MQKKNKALYIARFSILLALVIVLQIWGSSIKIGATSISLVLIPIVLGGILLGIIAGTLLGFSFGIVTLIAGVIGADPFTMILFQAHPVLTSFLCLFKGAAAGFVSAFLYKIISKKQERTATFVAALSAPITNTALFIAGALFMSETLLTNFISDGTSVLYFLVVICAGLNFIVELSVNIISAPALYRINKIAGKKGDY